MRPHGIRLGDDVEAGHPGGAARGAGTASIMRTVVVLPAPLGPSMERPVPPGTERLTPSTAVKSSKRYRSTASMAGASWPRAKKNKRKKKRKKRKGKREKEGGGEIPKN